MRSINCKIKKGGWLGPRLTSVIPLFMCLCLAGCATRTSPPCVKDGREYCVTGEWIFSETWYSCYLRGISCTQGGCWENAREEFLRAVRNRDVDARWVRTYGMHRMPEYFPNREIGIAYYHLKDLDSAIRYLTLSLGQCESAKTKFYINKVRAEKLLLTGEDREPPRLSFDPSPPAVATPVFTISGSAQDDTFVADILLRVNGEAPLSLMELSLPLAFGFSREVTLRQGINQILIRVVDLLGREEEKKIDIVLDQEGPMLYFAGDKTDPPYSPSVIQGLLYDPSGIGRFIINGKKVPLMKVEGDLDTTQAPSPYPVYSFRHPISPMEQARGILNYYAEDALKNPTAGSFPISPKGVKEEKGEEEAHPLEKGHVRVAMAPSYGTSINSAPYPLLLSQGAGRRAPESISPESISPESISIDISGVPGETFNEEICPQIGIIAGTWINEVSVNGEPLLSIYGLDWTDALGRAIRRYLKGKGEGRLLFNRMFRLSEGENRFPIKVTDVNGKVWEKAVKVVKKTRKIHQVKERWRVAIPVITSNIAQEGPEKRQKDLTYQLTGAFVNQGRFRIIDLENLPIIIDEKELPFYLGSPLLGLSPEIRIWIDTFLFTYLQVAEDSLTLSASMVDLDTGEVLATQDVCEEIDPAYLAWEEGLREHTLHICSILAAKFKGHFPLCEGKVISLTGDELKAGICREDGLKKGMKLLLFTGDLDREGDYALMGDAKVKEVLEGYSLARLLDAIQGAGAGENAVRWRVITR